MIINNVLWEYSEALGKLYALWGEKKTSIFYQHRITHEMISVCYLFAINTVCTWNMLSPSNDHHQFSVCQVTKSGKCFDVTVWNSGVRHSIDLLWFSHQQMGDNLVICKNGPEHYKITSSIILHFKQMAQISKCTRICLKTLNLITTYCNFMAFYKWLQHKQIWSINSVYQSRHVCS